MAKRKLTEREQLQLQSDHLRKLENLQKGGRRPMTVFSYIVTATGAATLAALFVCLLDRIDQPRKR